MHQTTRPLLTSRIQDIRRNRAQIFLLLCVVLWATTFIVMKRGLAVISPGLLIFVRFAAASVVVYACFHRRISWTKLNICKGVAIGLPAFAGFLLQVTGLTMTTSSKSAFITGLCVVIAPVLSVIFLHERHSRRTAAALLFAVCGLWIISFGFTLHPGRMGTGDILTILGAVAFSIQVLAIQRFSDTGSFYAATFFQLITVTVCSFLYLLATRQTFAVPPASWPLLLYLALFTTVITLLLQNRFQREITVAQASVIYALEPVFTAILAALLLREHIGPAILAGGALLVLASALS